MTAPERPRRTFIVDTGGDASEVSSDEPRPSPVGSPWPRGHGLQRRASGVCLCGRAVLDCEAMAQWARHRAQRR